MIWNNSLAFSVFGIFAILLFTSYVHFEANASMQGGAMMNHVTPSTDNMTNHIDLPLKQLARGVSTHDIKCLEGYSLIFNAFNNSPACVKPSVMQLLVMRGWALIENRTIDMKNNDISNGTNHSMSSMNQIMETGPDNTHNHMVDESQFEKAPTLVGITGYINTTPQDLKQEMKGKVILYNFWTWSCINCIHELPYVNQWYEKYADKGLLVIGVHTPEASSAADPIGIKNAVVRDGIKYPVVLDTNWNTWAAFGNHYWPRSYLADANGYLRYNHIGEGSYDVTEKEIQTLLEERNQTS